MNRRCHRPGRRVDPPAGVYGPGFDLHGVSVARGAVRQTGGATQNQAGRAWVAISQPGSPGVQPATTEPPAAVRRWLSGGGVWARPRLRSPARFEALEPRVDGARAASGLFGRGPQRLTLPEGRLQLFNLFGIETRPDNPAPISFCGHVISLHWASQKVSRSRSETSSCSRVWPSIWKRFSIERPTSINNSRSKRPLGMGSSQTCLPDRFVPSMLTATKIPFRLQRSITRKRWRRLNDCAP